MTNSTGESQAKGKLKVQLALGLYALLGGMALLIAGRLIPAWGAWYAVYPFYRAQSDALAAGRLALGTAPAMLEHDLCWAQGGVHQVWGLGIPLWRLPLDLVSRAVLGRPFPDRFAFGLFAAVTLYLLAAAFLGPMFVNEGASRKGHLCRGIGTVVIFFVFPPFLTLLGCRAGVWEEALAYTYLYGIGLAAGLTLLALRPRWSVFVALCAAAGLGGLFRPTLVFYGGATALAGVLVMMPVAVAHSRIPLVPGMSALSSLARCRGLCLGLVVFLLGGGFLWYTNFQRFGSGFEFGHRLNLQKGSFLRTVYATRFSNPFDKERLRAATRELLGAMFLVRGFNGGQCYAPGVFPGQTSSLRWREFYFTTYDWTYVPLLLAGWASTVYGLRARRFREQPAECGGGVGPPTACGLSGHAFESLTAGGLDSESCRIATLLGVWSLAVTGLLFVFYLYTPAISSRYMLDFGPAFAACFVSLWWSITAWVSTDNQTNNRRLWVSCALLIGWLLFQFGKAESAYGVPRVTNWKGTEDRLAESRSRPAAKPLPSRYRKGDDLEAFCIPYNGAGWDKESGQTKVAVILFVESPECLELEVAARPGVALDQPTAVREIRARVGLDELTLLETRCEGDCWRVRFAAPEEARYRAGLQCVFVAFVPPERIGDLDSPWVLKSVSWSREAKDGE